MAAPSEPITRAKPAKRVSIREIARQAGVSTATVSMVLNDNPKITQATREKVRKVIDRAGYQPNRIAQSLSGKYTRVLGVLLPTLRHALADPYFGELISGICDRAARLGHKVTLESAKPDFIREKKHLELFDRRFVDGVLCIGFNDRHVFLKDFAKAGHPMVVVNNQFDSWGVDQVVCDYRSGTDQVMTYLQQLGHTKIGLIHGSPDVFTSRVIIDVFKHRTPELDDTFLEDGHFTEEHGIAATHALLERHPDLTAIFAGNDKMALGAMRALSLRGIKVPEQISVVGFDDIPYSKFVTPALTTVHLPFYEAGDLACERLIQRIRGKNDRINETLSTHLVLRESTGIVPRA
ncbi:LacI family DNA-binding transcriptional regulator [Algisphaera agarilytica]|uniref:LacI family transcriptional regulator n=1 Tax=Algisphaera agarilytica TaxID=1385975 RepID=A0A7X0LJT4_9BACT|nr:LacI family DNA-binding transcriptional regulator [Algisphaera agarilytica]MBB6429182.1 LacI family transcriptional regulator [Algisphaera agarilytica]